MKATLHDSHVRQGGAERGLRGTTGAPHGPPRSRLQVNFGCQARNVRCHLAKLLLVALSFCWGLSWTAMRIALYEVSPWTLRFIGYSVGALTVLLWLKARGRSLAIPGGRNLLHVLAARCLSWCRSASPAPTRN